MMQLTHPVVIRGRLVIMHPKNASERIPVIGKMNLVIGKMTRVLFCL
ncbi:MAG: hypothetical protein KDD99_26545 [Bacteroidetes bacterium]|nr:hypothetical protein [Bacteroidota bacterium]